MAGDRQRPSWRELDGRRDRGGGGRRNGGGRSGGGDGNRTAGPTHAQKNYRAALEQAFESGGIGGLVERLQSQHRPAASASPRPASAPAEVVPAAPVEPAGGTPLAEEAATAPRRTAGSVEITVPPELESRQKLLAKAKAAVSQREIERAVDGYVGRFGWPGDLEFLAVALEHRQAPVVLEALAQIDKAVAKERPRRSGLLGARLRTLEELAGDDDVRTRAAALRRKL